MVSGRALLIVSALVFALGACGKDMGSNSGTMPAQAPSPGDDAAAPGDGVADATRDMVAGVTTGKAGGLVDLKFKIKSRPELGQPLAIDIAILPKVASELMRANFIASEGLTVRTSPVPADYQQVQPGAIFRHELTVVPRENGVYFVSAIVLVQTDAGDVARTFSIPVVVGAPPESEATGQAP